MSFVKAIEIEPLLRRASELRLWVCPMYSPRLAWKMQQSARRCRERAERLKGDV